MIWNLSGNTSRQILRSFQTKAGIVILNRLRLRPLYPSQLTDQHTLHVSFHLLLSLQQTQRSRRLYETIRIVRRLSSLKRENGTDE